MPPSVVSVLGWTSTRYFETYRSWCLAVTSRCRKVYRHPCTKLVPWSLHSRDGFPRQDTNRLSAAMNASVVRSVDQPLQRHKCKLQQVWAYAHIHTWSWWNQHNPTQQCQMLIQEWLAQRVVEPSSEAEVWQPHSNTQYISKSQNEQSCGQWEYENGKREMTILKLGQHQVGAGALDVWLTWWVDVCHVIWLDACSNKEIVHFALCRLFE